MSQMTKIDYAKYKKMNKKQLFNALLNEEKKQAKTKEKLEQELKEIEELISYLESKMKSSLNEPECYNVKNAPILNFLKEEVEKMPKEQVEQIKAEINAEMFGAENV
ncbi:hypothetical protein [Campylobacter devanensis]|uniref:hypothetical protein n=1 Tax=Campylobacter devanensis TaxID=3161138 RepID=UPI000A35058D|nr:hypothetical protein [Campylobacter sp. P160]